MHYVQRQYLNVTLNGTETEGFALQQRLSDICHTQLVPALAQALDRCGLPDGTHLRIDRLEIDLGNLDLHHLEDDLPTAVAQSLEKHIQQKIADQARSRPSDPTATEDPQNNQLLRTPDTLLYYLRNGRLPWYLRLPAGSSLEALLAADLGATPFSATQRDALLVLLRASHWARQRLVWQFSDTFLVQLLRHLSPASASVLESLRKKVDALGLAKSVQKAMWDELWNAAFLYAGQRTAPIAWLQKIAAALQPALPARAYTRWLRQVSDTWPDITPSQRAPANSYEDQQQHSDTEAEVYIENAGLVLVHPFLPSLFESLHLLDPTGQLAQPERALLVLHYLATGRTRAEEHELTLPKILCGLSQAAPVDVRQVMSKAEKAKADKLLLAIISYWEALRNTTPDGLRGNFLYRTGKLSRREDNAWRLLVERKTHDILLNQLPWGIGMIKLPWMTGILQVDWN